MVERTQPKAWLKRSDAPEKLTEQEADVWCCLANVHRVMTAALFDHHEPHDIERALSETTNLLNCLEHADECREAGVWR